MIRRSHVLISMLAVMLVVADVSLGQGRGGGSRGGGGASRGGGGGASRAGGGSGNRGGGSSSYSPPRGGASRPSSPSPGASRPSTGRPGGSAGQGPSYGGGSTAKPPTNRPNGGLTPSTRPSAPSGGYRPETPSSPGTRPGPGAGGPGGVTRPGSRPDTSAPNLGNRPGTGNRPDYGNRPDSGSRPGIGDRPSIGNPPGGGAVTRPGTGERPVVGNRPGTGGTPGGGTAPKPGDVGDFLGIGRPVAPGGGGPVTTLPARPGGDRPTTLPGLGDRPGTGGRPGVGDRPNVGNRPGAGDRPGAGNRPGAGDRPNLADRDQWNRNPTINRRPGWANIDRSVNINVHNRWNNAFVNPGRRGWWNRPSNRMAFWAGWGMGVRRGWGSPFLRRNAWFGGPWWARHRFPVGGWHFHYWNHGFPPSYWWGVPPWARLTAWFTWSAPPVVWAQPVYYDYGKEGNVTYVNNNVYIGGEQVATADEFAMSAMDLATVAPPETEEQAAAAEWMPLGTFAVSTNEKDVEPSQVVQLAVDKAGVISGTLYNIDTDQAQAIQGQVDKDTQRVAFRLGESETVVAETGLYNLTQQEAPLLIHFGTERTENYLLVRLEYAEDGDEAQQAPAPAGN